MDDLHTHRAPDFNLFLAAEALQGITESLYELLFEVPDQKQELDHWIASVTGLVWAGKRIAAENRVFLHVASDMHRFPTKFDDVD